MAIIAGATYRGGVAINENGAIYVNAIPAASLAPPGTTNIPGTNIPFGKSVTNSGALNVRFV